ncbi:MAG TPA: GH1 family beta-glucosidase [Polyangiaceae bacterium]|jgi:beta-glucosidase|nr:GH1 family beta-glucosidase [Polyangiaceae bacterium]
MTSIAFPKSFVWGAASAAYQIEGAYAEDGRGESIWDRFSHTPGKISDGSTGDVACDHYHRYPEDVAFMKELGLGAYRFSVAWPRVIPDGTGAVNQKGLDFYSRLVDALLEAGVTPWLTLYHWDLPAALADQGGWTNRDVAGWFAEYASVVGRALGDRVEHFMTLNEPQVFTIFGYLTGVHAPGTIDLPGYVLASHHTNLAHGRAVQALRAAARGAKVGIVEQVFPIHPLSTSDADRAAAWRVDGLFNRWFLDPILKGSYPEDLTSLLSFLPSPVLPGDLETIRQPMDFLGVNHYTRQFARHDPSLPLFEFLVDLDHREPGSEYTEMAWEIHPPSFGEILARLRTDYGNPLVYVTENGAATHETVEGNAVHDPARRSYLKSYLAELHGQLGKGSRIGGYFVWSLTDNFEWAFGYGKHFGLIRVDYETQARTPKDSARWYASVIQKNGFEL